MEKSIDMKDVHGFLKDMNMTQEEINIVLNTLEEIYVEKELVNDLETYKSYEEEDYSGFTD